MSYRTATIAFGAPIALAAIFGYSTLKPIISEHYKTFMSFGKETPEENKPELENELNGKGLPNCLALNTLELNHNLPCVRKTLYSTDSAGATYKLAL